MEKAIKNITAERIIIGIFLNHPTWMVDFNNHLKTDYFFSIGHKMIHHIIYSLLEENAKVVDNMAILARSEKIVKGKECLEENGGYEYLENLKDLAVNYSMEELRKYIDDVIGCAFKRDHIKINEEINAFIESNPTISMYELDQKVDEKRKELMARYNSNGNSIKVIEEVFDETWDDIENSVNENGITGLPSCIPEVNKFFTYENSELIVIGGRPKYGKSNWAINETHNLAVVGGMPVAYFDTEMKRRTFILRMTALDSGVPINEIKTGVYKKELEKVIAVETAKERIKYAPIYHKYDHAWDKQKVQSRAKLLKLQKNIAMLVYDYIKVMEVGTGKEHSLLGDWTVMLKNLVGELDIPCLTFAQMSPYERRLADSDKINRYASVIGYLLPKTNEEIARDFGAEKGGTDFLYVDYNRIGSDMKDPSKGINLLYTRYLAKFQEAPYQVLNDEYQ